MPLSTHSRCAPSHIQPVTEPHTPRILLVDDDVDIHEIIARKLRPFGIEVECAFHGMQGVSEAIRSEPDLIVADLAMPNGDGIYVLDCVKSHARAGSIPVIVVTGMRDPDLKRRALAAGACCVLKKPLRFEQLLKHIQRYLETDHRDDQEV